MGKRAVTQRPGTIARRHRKNYAAAAAAIEPPRMAGNYGAENCCCCCCCRAIPLQPVTLHTAGGRPGGRQCGACHEKYQTNFGSAIVRSRSISVKSVPTIHKKKRFVLPQKVKRAT